MKYINITVDDDGIVTVVSKKNIVPSCGRRYIIDRLFSTGTHGWNDSRVSHIAIGLSTNTNSGVTGPTDAVPVATGGSWLGPATTDYKLSSELLRKPCTVRRTGDVLYAKATFLNGDFTAQFALTDPVVVVEEGFFLSDTAPNANPIDATAQEVNGMLSRATITRNDGSGFYIAEPLYKHDDSASFTIGYEFNLEGL